ncbi:hypothetical protein CR513_62359, partial [Mucuna pruriens]
MVDFITEFHQHGILACAREKGMSRAEEEIKNYCYSLLLFCVKLLGGVLNVWGSLIAVGYLN